MHITLPDRLTRYMIRRDVTVAVWMTLAGLCVAVLTIVSLTSPSASPQNLADTFMRDVQMNNSVGAYGLTTNGYKARVGKVGFYKMLARASQQLQGGYTLQRLVTKAYINPSLLNPPTDVLLSVHTPNGERYVRIRVVRPFRGLLVDDFQWSSSPIHSALEQ